jgi:predicted nucleic-acid-binding protein
MILIDANIVLRYLLDDHETLSAQATAIIEQHEVILMMEVACEVVYVLQKVYKVERAMIEQYLKLLLKDYLVNMHEPEVFSQALSIYAKTRLDFVDALLCAYHDIKQCKVYTFDKKLQNYVQ